MWTLHGIQGEQAGGHRTDYSDNAQDELPLEGEWCNSVRLMHCCHVFTLPYDVMHSNLYSDRSNKWRVAFHGKWPPASLHKHALTATYINPIINM